MNVTTNEDVRRKIPARHVGPKPTTFRRGRAWRAGSEMPALRHQPGEVFDPARSEVFAWIAQQPALMAFVMERLKSMGAIEFDRGTGTWRGVARRTFDPFSPGNQTPEFAP